MQLHRQPLLHAASVPHQASPSFHAQFMYALDASSLLWPQVLDWDVHHGNGIQEVRRLHGGHALAWLCLQGGLRLHGDAEAAEKQAGERIRALCAACWACGVAEPVAPCLAGSAHATCINLTAWEQRPVGGVCTNHAPAAFSCFTAGALGGPQHPLHLHPQVRPGTGKAHIASTLSSGCFALTAGLLSSEQWIRGMFEATTLGLTQSNRTPESPSQSHPRTLASSNPSPPNTGTC